MSRRRIPPTSRPTPIPTFATQNAANSEFSEPVIKHIQFIQSQSFSQKNEIVNEAIIFIFSLIAASSQFVHLYRSVWWFADSYTNYTVVSFINLLTLHFFIACLTFRIFISSIKVCWFLFL